MDLGSAICTPKRPNCPQCPWIDDCQARKLGIQETLPVKAPKMVRPLRRGAAFVVTDRSGAVLLVKRPEKGFWPPCWSRHWDHGAGNFPQKPWR